MGWDDTDERASVVIIENGKVLLIHRIFQKREYYVFPGGGVEAGESVEEAACREAKEETSLTVTIDRLLSKFHNPYDRRENYFYLVKQFSGKLALGGPEKARMSQRDQYTLEWVPISQIEQMQNLYPLEGRAELIRSIAESEKNDNSSF